MLNQSASPNEAPNALLLPWLTHEHFLTEKLKSTAGDARLEVLSQRWELADDWDCAHLTDVKAQRVLHREIVMWAFDTPCWYARTILPDATKQANRALFDRLQTESLGHLIFHGTDITRVSLKSYCVDEQTTEYGWLQPWMHQDATRLWVRLSEFSVLSHVVPAQAGIHAQHDHYTSSKMDPRLHGDDNKASFFLVEILLPGLMRYLS
jgi:chorismate--pyruvate lyase